MTIGRYLLVIFLFAILVVGCETLEDPVPITGPGEEPLFGTAWVLGKLYGQELIHDTTITAAFVERDEAHRMTGSAGCNTYTALFVIEEDVLNFDETFSSDISCAEPDGIMQQEQAYLAALQEVSRFQMTEERLEMLNEAEETILTFNRQ